VTGDILNNVRPKTSRTSRDKNREYLKEKINVLETNSNNKRIRDLYRGINEFRKDYQPRTNLVKHENVDLLVDSHSILNIWKNCFCHLLNVRSINGVKQLEMHTAEPLVQKPSFF
jgi:hypothetical protein